MQIVVPEAVVYDGHCDNKYNRLSRAILSKCRGLWPSIKDVTVASTNKCVSLYGLYDDNGAYCATIYHGNGKYEKWILSHKRQELIAALDSGNSFTFDIEPETAFLSTYYVKVMRDNKVVLYGCDSSKHGRVLNAIEAVIGCRVSIEGIINDAENLIHLYETHSSDTIAYVKGGGRKFRLNITLPTLTKLLDSGEEFTFTVTEVSNNKHEKENDMNFASTKHESDSNAKTRYVCVCEHTKEKYTICEYSAESLEELVRKMNCSAMSNCILRFFKEVSQTVRTPMSFTS